jgi:hypothetical protein
MFNAESESYTTEQYLLVAETAFCIFYLITAGHTLTNDSLQDRKSSAAFASGAILGFFAMAVLLAHKAQEHKDEPMSAYITGTDALFGTELPIVGSFAALGLRHLLVPQNPLFFRINNSALTTPLRSTNDHEIDDNSSYPSRTNSRNNSNRLVDIS